MNKDIWTHKHSDSAIEPEIDFSPIPRWKRDLIDIVSALTVKRIKLRITQDELAKKMSVSQPVIARFENKGRTPGLESIYKYAEGLGVELKPLQFASKFRIHKPENDEEDFLDEVFAPWQINVYGIVADLTVCRIKQRMTQAELARRMHTSQSVITRFERMGRIPTIEFIYKVAEALGVELEALGIREFPQYSCSFEDTSDLDSMVVKAEELFSITEHLSHCGFSAELSTELPTHKRMVDHPQKIELSFTEVLFTNKLCAEYTALLAEPDSKKSNTVPPDWDLYAA